MRDQTGYTEVAWPALESESGRRAGRCGFNLVKMFSGYRTEPGLAFRMVLLVGMLLAATVLSTGCTMSEAQCYDEGYEDGVKFIQSPDSNLRLNPPKRCSRDGDIAYYEGVAAGWCATGITCWTTVIVEDGEVRFYNQVYTDRHLPKPDARSTWGFTDE